MTSIHTATQTAPPVTPGPSVSATASVDLSCIRAAFIGDVTTADNAIVPAGKPFTKTWRIKNIGNCAWTGAYSLVFMGGDQMSAPNSVPLGANVAAAQTVDVSVSLLAPTGPGQYEGFWRLRTSDGRIFGLGTTGIGDLWVKIRVLGTAAPSGTLTTMTASPWPTSTSQPTPQATPPSRLKIDFVTDACAAQWQSNDGVLACPGQDGDPRGFALPQKQAHLEDGSTAALPALVTFPSRLKDGYVLGLYPAYEVAPGDHFKASVGCEAGALSCSVLFRVSYLDSVGAAHDLWTLGEFYDGKYYNLDLDLSQLAGQQVRLVLSVSDLGSSAGDRALWAQPRIVQTGGNTPAGASTATAAVFSSSPTAPTTATTAAPAATNAAASPTAPAGTATPKPPIPLVIESILSFLRQLFGGK